MSRMRARFFGLTRKLCIEMSTSDKRMSRDLTSASGRFVAGSGMPSPGRFAPACARIADASRTPIIRATSRDDQLWTHSLGLPVPSADPLMYQFFPRGSASMVLTKSKGAWNSM